MLGFLSRKRAEATDLLSEAQARSIIDAEIQRRGWAGYENHRYYTERRKGRLLWCYSGIDFQYVGAMMQIAIDARTGELVIAAVAPR